MKPIILTNSFRRPRATLFAAGPKLADKGEVYATTDEIIHIITDVLDATPVQLPTAADLGAVGKLLDIVDGILLPGAASNMDPHLYNQTPNGMPQTFAPDHDALDMFLVRQALQRGIPLLGICRGMQAINLALGGSLHQSIKDIQKCDHLCSIPGDGESDDPRELHAITPVAGGKLAAILGGPQQVNSIHEQAVHALGRGVVAEAYAPDGIVEALSVQDSPAFLLGVQWHPESQPHTQAAQAVFDAFGEATRK